MIHFLQAGYFTSIQDQGRDGFRYYGVPVSGPMDSRAFALANALLPVENDTCVLECHLQGPVIRFEKNVDFVITGAEVEAFLGPKKIDRQYIYEAQKGDVLKVGKVKQGLRVYIKFFARIDRIKPMGSFSMYAPITRKAQFTDGDSLLGEPVLSKLRTNAHLKINDDYLHQTRLEVTKGPDFYSLSKQTQAQLFEKIFRVIAQSRMGYRLEGDFCAEASAHLSSQLVLPGMVQLTPSNQLLVAMADAQVTGGYLQILQLTHTAQQVLSQKKEGDCLNFVIYR